MKTGEDLHLQLKEADDVPKDYFILQWKFNGNDNLVSFFPSGEPRVSDRYRGRVEVSVGSFSVKLKNLQKSDSGVYAVLVTGSDKNTILSEYKVTVEDPVSPVKLTVNSGTNSSDPCDLTVTCRSLHSHQISISTTVTCNTTTCSQEGGERSEVTTSVVNAAIIGSSASAAFLVLGLILCIITCSQAAVQPQRQSGREDSTPTSTYALVQFHTGPDESTRTKVIDMPETVYAE
ncbi:hypothetical protein INR49_010475, partial [Caranx melampygus]